MFPPRFTDSLRRRPYGRTTEMPGRAAAPLRARDHAPIHPADLNQQPAVVAPPFAVSVKIVALTGRRCRPVGFTALRRRWPGNPSCSDATGSGLNTYALVAPCHGGASGAPAVFSHGGGHSGEECHRAGKGQLSHLEGRLQSRTKEIPDSPTALSFPSYTAERPVPAVPQAARTAPRRVGLPAPRAAS